MPPELACAREAANVAGSIIAAAFRDGMTTARAKDGSAVDLVTDTDVAAEQAIVEVIRAQFPQDAILAEEQHAANANADRLWIVDPLDGTTNFAHGIPHSAVSIAFYESGEAVCGVVQNPMTSEQFEAVRGAGATRNGEPIRVADHESLSETLVGVGFYYDRGAMMRATLAAVEELFRQSIHGIRRFGTASLDLCRVACGMYGGFFEYQLSPWDFAAGRLIVDEAAGMVTTCDGSRLPLRKTTVLAGNPAIHAAMLPIVERHIPK